MSSLTSVSTPAFIYFHWCRWWLWAGKEALGASELGCVPKQSAWSVWFVGVLQRDGEKSFPAFTVCLQRQGWTSVDNVDFQLMEVSRRWLHEGLNMKPNLVASNPPLLITGCCTQTNTTVLTICIRFHFGNERGTYFSKHWFLEHCLMGRKIMQSQARNLFTEKEAQTFTVSPPP